MGLTSGEIEKYQEALLEMKREILHKISEADLDVKTAQSGKGYSQHQADEGSDDFDRNITLRLSDEDRSILRKIDRALEKIQEGSYGICELSGKEIPKKRLDAIPYATTTVAAQSAFEKGEMP